MYKWKICQSCHTHYYHAQEFDILFICSLPLSKVKERKMRRSTMQTYLLVHIIRLYMCPLTKNHKTEIFINTELLASTIIIEWETCYAMKMMMSRGECVRIISIWTWLTRDLKVVEVGEDITKCPKNKITFFSYQMIIFLRFCTF